MEFNVIKTQQQARDLARILPQVIAIDTEFVKGNPRTTKLLSVIIADANRAWAVEPSLLPTLAPFLKSRGLILLQDFNHCDTLILLKHGCDLRGSYCLNTIDIHHLLDENADHSLDARCKLQFSDDYKSVFWGKYENFEDAPEDEALEYQCKDAIYTYRLGMADLERMTAKEKELLEHVRRLSLALFDTELNGLLVNEPLIRETRTTMKTQIDAMLPKLRSEFNDYCEVWELRAWATKLAELKTDKGRARAKRPEFSFNSTQQISTLLYDEEYLALPVLERTKKKNPSTAFETIERLAREYPEVQPLVEYSEIKSVYSTFVEGMLERVDNGRIYPHFNVSGTTSGRISHSDPNMGNLPKEGVIRNFFVAGPGKSIIGADYAQLEVVIELNQTDDPGLKEIVLGGASKHDLFKADLDAQGFNLPRSQVKNVNFALQYDAQAPKIAKMVGCSVSDAERIIDVFYTRFNGVKRLKVETCETLAREGKVTNLAGRTRRFSAPRNKYEKAKQERQAYNFLIQGVAGEVCNRAFYRFAEECKQVDRPVARPLFPVHDEIVAEVENEYVLGRMEQLVRVMEQSNKDFEFKYPVKAVAYGPFTEWRKT